MPVTIAITGDSILNKKISALKDEKFLSMVKIIRDADVGYTHLETLIHDYEGAELYPAAEAAGTWMRSPRLVADELKWLGFDIVSTACNHSLDYSYGGLFSTWKALNEAGLPHAGTGMTLGEARAPAYLDTEKGRVAVISMCSSFVGWAAAGEPWRGLKGRPGLNPLRYYYRVDADTLEKLKQLALKLDWWVTQVNDKTWYFKRAGLDNSITKYVLWDKPGVTTVAEEEDVEGNLRSIKDARRQADYVLVQLHCHESDTDKGISAPPKFAPVFARQCIDAGADIFIGEGSHAPFRGIEVYKNRPIFYDPGDFILMSDAVTKLPYEFYYWRIPAERRWQSTLAEAYDARAALIPKFWPPGGLWTEPVLGAVIAICSFGEGKLVDLKLHPVTVGSGAGVGGGTTRIARSMLGVPKLADAATAQKIVSYLGELSAPFGTGIEFKDGVGIVKL